MKQIDEWEKKKGGVLDQTIQLLHTTEENRHIHVVQQIVALIQHIYSYFNLCLTHRYILVICVDEVQTKTYLENIQRNGLQ
jgi:hypothetical protein